MNGHLRRVLADLAEQRIELAGTAVDYSGHTVQELKDAVTSRNEGREEADLIQVASTATKPQLIAALEADDRAQADAETTEGA